MTGADVLAIVIVYLLIGLGMVGVAVSRGAGVGTVLVLAFCCTFMGPLGWLIAASHEGDEHRRRRKDRKRADELRALSITHRAQRKLDEERRRRDEERRIREAEEQVWNARWKATRSVEKADSAVIAHRAKLAGAIVAAHLAIDARARERKELLKTRADSEVFGQQRDGGQAGPSS